MGTAFKTEKTLNNNMLLFAVQIYVFHILEYILHLTILGKVVLYNFNFSTTIIINQYSEWSGRYKMPKNLVVQRKTELV